MLYRPATDDRHVDVLCGSASTHDLLAQLPVPARRDAGGATQDLLALVPYRQIRERGYDCHDDGTPLLAITVTDHHRLRVRDAMTLLADPAPAPVGGAFDLDDRAYAQIVRTVLADEIGRGEGSNFVIRRSFCTELPAYTLRSAMACFGALLRLEHGAHWTFLIHTGTRTLVGATPERHIGVYGGEVSMRPISGTYRYPPGRVRRGAILDFLGDTKEIEELAMVLDEELKMMARVCPDGGRVRGPYLRQMARLAHTEYAITGRSSRDLREILRESMFAPPVVGSPLQNACRVIHRYERSGRGYYSGVAALIGHDDGGAPMMDSAILIRTADIDGAGRVRIDVGATLVRHSSPCAEVAETSGKAATLLAALGEAGHDTHGPIRTSAPRRTLAHHPRVRSALAARNGQLSSFWLGAPAPRSTGRTDSPRILVVDGEDMFTAMLTLQLRALGADVLVRRHDEPIDVEHDVLVIGPGPGDPRADEPKMRTLRRIVRVAARTDVPVLGLCLGHQIIAAELGFELIARAEPNQGLPLLIDLFGVARRVGFYNTFVAVSEVDRVEIPRWGRVLVSRDPATGQVHALRGGTFSSFQFHPESVLTRDGPGILANELARLREARLQTEHQ
ncbi:MAG TPA: chorismate-binding protein [Micromonosporaceae bacterium]